MALDRPHVKRNLNAGWIIGTLLTLILAGLPTAYFGLYLVRAERDTTYTGEPYRVFRSEFEANVFTPAVRIEGYFTNQHIWVVMPYDYEEWNS